MKSKASIIKNILLRLIVVLLFFVFSSYAIYAISQGKPESTLIDENDKTVPESVEAVKSTLVESKIADFNSLLSEKFSNTGNPDGYFISDGMYDEKNGYILSLLPKDCLSQQTELPNTYSYTKTLDDGTETKIVVLKPRMGYIIYNDGLNKKLLSYDGSLLLSNLPSNIIFLGERDKKGNPLFLYNQKYYTISQSDGQLLDTTFDPANDSRGIKFDYPSYYGMQSDANGVKIIRSGANYGYALGSKTIVAPGYIKDYNFQDGLGCAVDAQNRLYFFNDKGKLKAGGLVNVLYGSGDDFSEKKLGYYYFTEGLTRACEKKYEKGKFISEREILVKSDGKELNLPKDYSIVSYSDGVILLEKQGYFGYMNSNGVWLVNPEYTYARPFFEGLAVIGFANGKKGVIDKTGKFVVPMIFDEISDCSGGVICLFEKQQGHFIINKLLAGK